jgi:hypothetical protein
MRWYKLLLPPFHIISRFRLSRSLSVTYTKIASYRNYPRSARGDSVAPHSPFLSRVDLPLHSGLRSGASLASLAFCSPPPPCSPACSCSPPPPCSPACSCSPPPPCSLSYPPPAWRFHLVIPPRLPQLGVGQSLDLYSLGTDLHATEPDLRVVDGSTGNGARDALQRRGEAHPRRAPGAAGGRMEQEEDASSKGRTSPAPRRGSTAAPVSASSSGRPRTCGSDRLLHAT